MVERFVRNEEVRSSNLLCSTTPGVTGGAREMGDESGGDWIRAGQVDRAGR